MKKLLFTAGFYFLFVTSSFAIDQSIAGRWSIAGINATLIFSDSGSYIHFPADGITDVVHSITVSEPDAYNIRELTFIRRGTSHQIYQGIISTSGCFITGFKKNVNNLQKLPFVAQKSNCP